MSETHLFAEVLDRQTRRSSGADLVAIGAVQRERHMAAVLHAQVQQFFLGLDIALGRRVVERLTRGRLLQLGLAAAIEVDLRVVEGSPDLFDLFAFMNSLGDFPFAAEYSAGFAPDGSVSIVIGPELPRFEQVGIRGGVEHDAHDLEVALSVAQHCTELVAELKVRLDESEPEERDEPSAGTSSFGGDVSESPGEVMCEEPVASSENAFKSELIRIAGRHFSYWSQGSEWEWAHTAIDILDRAGLIADDSPVARAHSVAALVTLWALHVEFSGRSGGGSTDQWEYGVTLWVDEGLSQEELVLLNEDSGLGWDFDDEEYDVDVEQLMRDIVYAHHKAVTSALIEEQGETFLFASLWATRFDDAEYPLAGEVVNDIVNHDLDGYKSDGYMWVSDGMPL